MLVIATLEVLVHVLFKFQLYIYNGSKDYFTYLGHPLIYNYNYLNLNIFSIEVQKNRTYYSNNITFGGTFKLQLQILYLTWKYKFRINFNCVSIIV